MSAKEARKTNLFSLGLFTMFRRLDREEEIRPRFFDV